MNKFDNEILIPRDEDGDIDFVSYFRVETLNAPDGMSPIDHYENFLDLIAQGDILKSFSDDDINGLVEFLCEAINASSPRTDMDCEGYLNLISRADEIMYMRHVEKTLDCLKDLADWTRVNKKDLLAGAVIGLSVDAINFPELFAKKTKKHKKHKKHRSGGSRSNSQSNFAHVKITPNNKPNKTGSGGPSPQYKTGAINGKGNAEMRSQGYLFCLNKGLEVLRKTLREYPLKTSSEMECREDGVKNMRGFSRGLVRSMAFDLMEEIGSSMKLKESEKAEWRRRVLEGFGG